MEQIIEKISEWDIEKLIELQENLEKIIASKSTNNNPYELCLGYNQSKGSGKCWVANVNKGTKKILSFVEAESVVKEDTYKGYKVYLLKDGHYLSCEEGTRSSDKRVYFSIINGKKIEE